MSTGLSDDLWAATSVSQPAQIDDASGLAPPHEFAADWEITQVDGLAENTNGPYCEGETVTVEKTYSGAGRSFGKIKTYKPNYTVNTAQNCTLANQAGAVFDFTVDSGAAGTTGNIIGITFDNPFNTASGVGVEHQITFDVGQYDVTCDSAVYDDANDNVDITYTIGPCGTADYNVDLYRDNDGTPVLAAEQTQTSNGQYTITDTNPNSGGLSDEYRVDVTDNSGNGTLVQCTISVSFPA